jgi:hypothetical protein
MFSFQDVYISIISIPSLVRTVRVHSRGKPILQATVTPSIWIARLLGCCVHALDGMVDLLFA